ncbi:MAG: M23 family metallopeptidase [Chitinophagaceae bacterium]
MIIVAQTTPEKKYPRNYFRNPLNIPLSLSGNFGELRPNHYHMGVDMKTMAKENLPVYAAADGYIARVKIEPAGFGRAIYINHPNGFTSLYAHLNDFFPALEYYVKEQQYVQEAWKVFLDIPPGLFPLKKGDFIANSGNTGGSQAPHLHFEIRSTDDDVNLNPMLFGLPVADNIKPAILRMSVYDRSRSTYEQIPRFIAVKKTAYGYTTMPYLITVPADKVSFAIGAFDTHTASTNPNGIYEASLYEDERFITGFQMDHISYDDTRYINAHIDYRTRAFGGSYLQHLSELPGYVNSIYYTGEGDGVINLSDGEVHSILILVKDANGNAAELRCSIQSGGTTVVTPEPVGLKCYPRMLNAFESEDCEFYIWERGVYDTVIVGHTGTVSSNPSVVSAVHTIGRTHIPVQDSFLIRVKPSRSLTPEKRNRVVMQHFAGSGNEVQKVEWNQDWASARFRDFGSFQLLVDESPPVIVPAGIYDGADLSKAVRITFAVTDNLGKSRNFRAELDGKWLRFTNDKTRNHVYRFDEMCPPGQHELKIIAEDEAGNVTTKLYQFRR